MASTRIVIGIAATAASALVGLAACSGSTTGTGSGDGGAFSSGGGTSGGGTSGSGASGGSAVKRCPSTGSTCTEAETATYNSCLQEKCDATYAKCFGSAYKSGTFTGDCGTYITCTQACACGDTACLAKCTISDACKTCLIPAAQNCAAMCTAPACEKSGSSGTSGGGGSNKTCADLKACCDKIAEGMKKDSCNATYDGVKGTDSTCSIVYGQYAGDCL